MTVEPEIVIAVAICFYIHSAPHVFSTGTELQHVARPVESDLP